MSIWTEWDPLELVIVGDCYQPGDIDWVLEDHVRDQFNQILTETKQDLDGLALLLTGLGVQVMRPQVIAYPGPVDLGTFRMANPTAPVVPRDQYLVYGDTIYQTYTSMPDRYLDSQGYYGIFQQLWSQGHNWISQPPPPLQNLRETDHWWGDNQPYHDRLTHLLLWHTATMLKCGDAVIVNNTGPGTRQGFDWMQRNMPDTRLIQTGQWGHIDHGFFMTDDDTVWCINPNWVPRCLANKRIIPIGHLVKLMDIPRYISTFGQYARFSPEWIQTWLSEWKGYDQAVSFDTNVLVVDPHNVVFSNEQPKLFEVMAQHGIRCHVAPQRHGMFWESGIHCNTLDLVRRGAKRTIIQPQKGGHYA